VLAPEIRPRATENPLSAAVREQYRIRIYRLGSAITPGHVSVDSRIIAVLSTGRYFESLHLRGSSGKIDGYFGGEADFGDLHHRALLCPIITSF
jgi:hypothetical protein